MSYYSASNFRNVMSDSQRATTRIVYFGLFYAAFMNVRAMIGLGDPLVNPIAFIPMLFAAITVGLAGYLYLDISGSWGYKFETSFAQGMRWVSPLQQKAERNAERARLRKETGFH